MPIIKGAASDYTRYQKVNAQSVVTTAKPTQSTVPSIALTSRGSVGSTAKASTVAVAVAPKTAVVTTSTKKQDNSKRG